MWKINLSLLLLLAAARSQTISPKLQASFDEVFTRGTDGVATTTLAPDDPQSCSMKDGSPGECVPFYRCNKNNVINTDGVGLIDVRSSFSPCPYLELCCLVPDIRPVNDPILPVAKPKSAPTQVNEVSAPMSKDTLVPVTTEARKGCGWRNPNGAGMRTTGDVNGETKMGEFPWVVAILKLKPLNDDEPDGRKMSVYHGAGSLIHPSVVLTAAHVIANHIVNTLKVRAGEWDLLTKAELYSHQERDVVSTVVHPHYDSEILFYDLGLAFLTSPMIAAPHVGVACLPPERTPTPAGTMCFANGWGKDKLTKGGVHAKILKKIEMPVVANSNCEQALHKTILGDRFQLHGSFMCAGGELGKDTCKGDGGAPLSCPLEAIEMVYVADRYILSGIVSWGMNCSQGGIPGVYVDVSVLRDWIDGQVRGRHYNSEAYNHLSPFSGFEYPNL